MGGELCFLGMRLLALHGLGRVPALVRRGSTPVVVARAGGASARVSRMLGMMMMMTKAAATTSSGSGGSKSIEQDVNDRMKAAMKAQDKDLLSAYRLMRAAMVNALKDGGNKESLTDAEAVDVLKKLAKVRKDSIEAYTNAGRKDAADKEARELAIIEQYLPTLADEGTVEQWVREAIAKSGAKGPADMGKVMGILMKAHRDELDGNMAKNIATEMLKAET
ncbi:protein YqeY [Porphyridium purpureum]|uniref:Protein YqeY n=1 Tax=Porphyridium purpureum TaxID=35688 RepID=A0A5J4YRT9_PORPP|nr:protein YqeY [Porphyridium purpureum]|eukprot:POR6015..scf236_6